MKYGKVLLVLLGVLVFVMSGCQIIPMSLETTTQDTASSVYVEEGWIFDKNELVDITVSADIAAGYYDLGRHERIGTLTMVPEYSYVEPFDSDTGILSVERLVFADGFESITQFCFPQMRVIGSDGKKTTVRWTCKETVIPKSVKSIEFSNYATCGVEKITVHEENPDFVSVDGIVFTRDMKTLVAYPNGRKDEEYIIPQTVENIERHAFAANPYIKKVVFHDNVKDIGDGTFYNCSSLESVVFPSGITSIGSYTFSRTAIREMTIPSSVEIVYRGAFENSVKLEKIFVPKSVKTMKGLVFAACSSLGEIVFEDDDFMPEDESAFYGTPWYHERAEKNEDLFVTKEFSDGGVELIQYKGASKSVRIPEGITSISEGAFMYCAPEEVIFPASMFEHHSDEKGSCRHYFCLNIAKNSYKLFPHAVRYAIADPESDRTTEEIKVNCEVKKRYFEKDGAIYYETSQTENYVLCAFPPAKTGSYEFPEGMIWMNDYAIYSTALTEVFLPDSFYSLKDDYNFYITPNLESLYVGKDTELYYLRNYSYIKMKPGENAEPAVIEDMDGDGLIDIRLPDNFLSVDKKLFLDLNEVGTVYIPKDLDYIPVFDRGDNETVKINKVVYEEGTEFVDGENWLKFGNGERVGYDPCVSDICEICLPASLLIVTKVSAIDKITLDEGNKRFKIVDNALYSYDGKSLLVVFGKMKDNEFVFPDSVNYVKECAFAYIEDLEKVTISDSVDMIYSSTFTGCSNLKSITIPEAVTYIGGYAFKNCLRLREVTFEGEKAEVENYAFENTPYERITNNIKKSDLE